MAWRVELLDRRVEKELQALPEDMRAHFAHIVELIEEFGPHNLHEPHVKSLGRALYEMRMRGRDGIARAIYILAVQQRVIVLHIFVKKTQKTPKQAIDLALKRAKET